MSNTERCCSDVRSCHMLTLWSVVILVTGLKKKILCSS